MINLYMSSATFGTNNNDTMHVCQIKTEEKSKLVIIRFSVQMNFYPCDASAIRILLFSNPTWQQQTSKIKKFNYLEEFKSTTRGH